MSSNVIVIDELYQKAVTDNEKNLKFWENHLRGLESLNFDVYTEKLKVPVLVPIGSKILFRGELKHTNEVTVSLGADYFVKCSVTQAEALRQHRINDAQSKIDLYRKEKEYLENRITFTKDNVYKEHGQEILEVYSEEEDKAWREKHRENVRKYKQGNSKDTTKLIDEIADAELWERLEELELQEELENELLDNYNEMVDKRKHNTFLENQQALLLQFKEEIKKDKDEANQSIQQENVDEKIEGEYGKTYEKDSIAVTVQTPAQASKHDLLQQVINKQNELENKLHELKYREREQPKTEQDLITKLDELEELDELEDEIERLDDVLQTEDTSTIVEEDLSKSAPTKIKKSISFAHDADERKTLEINFTHSDSEPDKTPYNPEENISKPSDLYEAYPNLFDIKTTSILKKSKYKSEIEKEVKQPTHVKFGEVVKDIPKPKQVDIVENIIEIKDVVENVGVNQHNIEGGARPTSLFKQRRMKRNS